MKTIDRWRHEFEFQRCGADSQYFGVTATVQRERKPAAGQRKRWLWDVYAGGIQIRGEDTSRKKAVANVGRFLAVLGYRVESE